MFHGGVGTSSPIYTESGSIAISRFDADGKEISSCLIPKSQKIWNTQLTPFYHSGREGSAQLLGKGNQLSRFRISTNPKNFISFLMI
jgi:hypothetical protein